MRSKVVLGLETLLTERRDLLSGRRIGLICHPASIDSRLRHSVDVLSQDPEAQLTALLGPQHGIRGETQDDMIEWSGFRDPATGLPVHSLYGRVRRPDEEMLRDVDALLFDLQDVGARYYTYIYTMALAMQTCADLGKTFLVLDRPNPVGGLEVEGNVVESSFTSFVGLFPLAVRHGMTVGEIALYFNAEVDLGCDLQVVPMRGWRRSDLFADTGLPWVLPSPNVPTPETAMVYSGMCLLEGTNVSEGRGTTRPFELSGAPWVDSRQLVDRLSAQDLPGAVLRPHSFIPTFHKWHGELVSGVQIHVTDPKSFRPFRTGLALLMAYRESGGERFQWKPPPYEYEFEKLPIDILCGTDRIRRSIESGASLGEIEESWSGQLAAFRERRQAYLLY